MIEVISGTDRPKSNTRRVAKYCHQLLEEAGARAQILDLMDVPIDAAAGGPYFRGAPDAFAPFLQRIQNAEGVLMIVPEYNGSFPGALKLFIDYWKYPEAFENRPMAFVGLGGRWGGLRPVEHLQQVFGYRNGYLFPERVFLSNVKDLLEEDRVKDPHASALLVSQARNFIKFIQALKSQGLDANSRLARA
jgi:chromate reductase, NAD(P)H dehydrogenase (quinone)